MTPKLMLREEFQTYKIIQNRNQTNFKLNLNSKVKQLWLGRKRITPFEVNDHIQESDGEDRFERLEENETEEDEVSKPEKVEFARRSSLLVKSSIQSQGKRKSTYEMNTIIQDIRDSSNKQANNKHHISVVNYSFYVCVLYQ